MAASVVEAHAHPRSSYPRLRILRARREDMPLIANFVRSSAEWYRPIVAPKDMGQHQVSERWGEENFARREFYIGVQGDTPVGTISLQWFGAYAYLGYIYLSVEHVGRGYGQQLMQFAEGQARARGMRGMALIAHPRATWAKRAYLKYGFEIVASHKEDVLSWQEGALAPYYEEGFQLYVYDLHRVAQT